MNRFLSIIVAALVALGPWISESGLASDNYIIVASTTSTKNSGLYDAILPQFTAATGIDVRIVAVGTGQAIRNARNGDADVLFVHHKPSEEAFVAEGYGVERFDVMYNDFVLIGPANDPAGIAGGANVTDALARIAAAEAPFASRGDDSGTNKKELDLWSAAGIDAKASSGSWYRETGSGMGATLNTAIGMGAYVLSDRATWLKFGNKADFHIVVDGDERMFNQYGIILVNPDRHPHVKDDLGQQFIDWVTGSGGQAAIAAYKIAGQQAFFANAN